MKETISMLDWTQMNGLYAVVAFSGHDGPMLDTDYGFTSKREACQYGKETYGDGLVAIVKVEWIMKL